MQGRTGCGNLARLMSPVRNDDIWRWGKSSAKDALRRIRPGSLYGGANIGVTTLQIFWNKLSMNQSIAAPFVFIGGNAPIQSWI